LCGFVAVIAVT